MESLQGILHSHVLHQAHHTGFTLLSHRALYDDSTPLALSGTLSYGQPQHAQTCTTRTTCSFTRHLVIHQCNQALVTDWTPHSSNTHHTHTDGDEMLDVTADPAWA